MTVRHPSYLDGQVGGRRRATARYPAAGRRKEGAEDQAPRGGEEEEEEGEGGREGVQDCIIAAPRPHYFKRGSVQPGCILDGLRFWSIAIRFFKLVWCC